MMSSITNDVGMAAVVAKVGMVKKRLLLKEESHDGSDDIFVILPSG